MKIVISSDHGGFELKNKVAEFLRNKGHQVEDYGPKEFKGDDDYPDYVVPLVEIVSKDENALGILLCRNGVGVSMLANKFENIRAALSFTPSHAASARKDDNANVLTLGADYTNEEEAFSIVEAFISTARHPSPSGRSTSTRTSTPSCRNVASKIGWSAPPSMSRRVSSTMADPSLLYGISTDRPAP